MGAILSGASKPQVDALYTYGCSIGAAFQIQDDIIDLMATLNNPARIRLQISEKENRRSSR